MCRPLAGGRTDGMLPSSSEGRPASPDPVNHLGFLSWLGGARRSSLSLWGFCSPLPTETSHKRLVPTPAWSPRAWDSSARPEAELALARKPPQPSGEQRAPEVAAWAPVPQTGPL